VLANGVAQRAIVIASFTAVSPFDPELFALFLADDEAGARTHLDDPIVAYLTRSDHFAIGSAARRPGANGRAQGYC
jgi:hypothetical protein